MDQMLIAKLSEYCDNLIGEETEEKACRKKKSKKRKSKSQETARSSADGYMGKTLIKTKSKRLIDSNKWDFDKSDIIGGINEDHGLFQGNEDWKNIPGGNTSCDKSANEAPNEFYDNHMVTDDGFKIVSSIPEDDSDVSDAFESDLEDQDAPQLSKNFSKDSSVDSRKRKTTEDGFKIITEIPQDDSDVSDAFTEDGDYDCLGEDLLEHRKAKSLNKQVLEMIDEFGLGENILKNKNPDTEEVIVLKESDEKRVTGIRNSRKKKKKKKYNGLQNTVTLASKIKPPVDVTIYNYGQKRVSNISTAVEESGVKDFLSANTKHELERELKRMRFEIFKLGMKGFSKEKKKETRVALAIRLGAKPPKKKNVGYKDLLITKKNEKKQEIEKREMDREMGIKTKKKAKSNPKKKPRAYSSQVGRYKDGVLSLSKKDLQKIKTS